jgi:CBS domain containing-hemolysin-like protein
MTLDYAALPLRRLRSGARLRAATPHSGERLTLDSRALSVMTDFAIVPAATIEPDASVEDANRSMIRRGVRSLIVIDHAHGVLGIITATDVLGERPMQVALERNLKRHEVAVREVMTPLERIEALPIDALIDAKIGHVAATLAKAGRQHALVVESGAAGDSVRGIFSLTQIAADLGIAIESTAVAGTFAEVEAALGR